MTKKSAAALAQYVHTRCDDAYLFSVKVGASCGVTNFNVKGDWKVLLTLLLNLIDRVMLKLKTNHHDEARELLCLSLLEYLTDMTPAPPSPPEKLSDSQRARRAHNSDRIIATIEEALK